MQVDGGSSYHHGHHRAPSTSSVSGGGGAWVESVKWQKRGRGELVSGAKDGRVVVWDVRKGAASAVAYPQQTHNQPGAPKGLSGIAIHEEANVVCDVSDLALLMIFHSMTYHSD